jgi:hypothetical protein
LSPEQRRQFVNLVNRGQASEALRRSARLDLSDGFTLEDATAVLQFVFPWANLLNNWYDVEHVAEKVAGRVVRWAQSYSNKREPFTYPGQRGRISHAFQRI